MSQILFTDAYILTIAELATNQFCFLRKQAQTIPQDRPKTMWHEPTPQEDRNETRRRMDQLRMAGFEVRRQLKQEQNDVFYVRATTGQRSIIVVSPDDLWVAYNADNSARQGAARGNNVATFLQQLSKPQNKSDISQPTQLPQSTGDMGSAGMDPTNSIF